VAIIGILAAIALPAYNNYIAKASYTEVTSAMIPYKSAVEEYFQNGSPLADLDTGATTFIAAPAATTEKAFNTLTVTDGVITAETNAYKGIPASTTSCVLTPVADAANRLVWTYSGDCLTNGWVKN